MPTVPTARKSKIEFWINHSDKQELKALCKETGYTVAEIMRRAAEEKIATLKGKGHNAS